MHVMKVEESVAVGGQCMHIYDILFEHLAELIM